MSKILDATCTASVVTADSVPVVGATILSQGIKPSEGILVMDGDKKTYVTSNAEDIKDLITNIKTVLDQIVVSLTALDAVTVSPGSCAASIALVTSLSLTLELQKELLK